MTKFSRGDKVFTYWGGDEVIGYVNEVRGNILLIKDLKHLDGESIDKEQYVMVFSFDQSSVRKPHKQFYKASYLKTMHPLSMIFAGTLGIFLIVILA